MFKDFFPVKVLFRPAETFAAIASGKTGWAWPLALYCASAAASAHALCSLPPEFLAAAAPGVQLAQDRGFWWYLAVGLPGGLAFALFFCALLSAFLPYISAGRLPARLAALVTAAGAYGFFFLLPFKTAPAYNGAARLLALLAAGGAAGLAARSRPLYARLLKAMLALSALTLAADALGAAAAAAGSVAAYSAGQYFFAALALVYLVKAAAAFQATTAARAAAAVVPAMLAGLAFLFSLSVLGVLSPEIFQALLLI
ncbi:MAG TPA: hypothetical protein PKI19_05160 [Elusimicrobiales bacterium]|nr:hypothetical protein [Elusimicrobiales bacterium]